jgi:hypothetical protein
VKKAGRTVAVAVATAVILWLIAGVSSGGLASAKEQALAPTVAGEAGDRPGEASVALQDSQEEPVGEDDDRVAVQLWTLLALAGAAGVGLLLFVVRAAMGWVKPPPPQESHH